MKYDGDRAMLWRKELYNLNASEVDMAQFFADKKLMSLILESLNIGTTQSLMDVGLRVVDLARFYVDHELKSDDIPEYPSDSEADYSGRIKDLNKDLVKVF